MVFNRKLKTSFKNTGKLYESSRKNYPTILIKDIIKISKIKKDSLILDIGCGTGKSTMPFTKQGYKILGIDLSSDMIKQAKKLSSKYKNVNYKVCSFEKTSFNKKSFDLILAGQSFHWLNPKIALNKIEKLLKPQGNIAIFWGFNKYKEDKFLLKVRKLFIKHCSNYPRDLEESREKTITKIKKSNLSLIKTKTYLTKEKYTKKQYFNLIQSLSWVISLDKKKKGFFLDELKKLIDSQDAEIVLPKKYLLIIAKIK